MKRLAPLSLIVILVATAGCGDPGKGRRSPVKLLIEANHPFQESWDFRFVLTGSGTRRVAVEAGYGAEYKTAAGIKHYLDKGINVTFFDTMGTLTTTITASRAVIHENQDIDVAGKVVLVSSGDTVIRTENARWTSKDGMIRSSRPVSVTTPGKVIRGQGFETDQALTRYRIFQGRGEAVIN